MNRIDNHVSHVPNEGAKRGGKTRGIILAKYALPIGCILANRKIMVTEAAINLAENHGDLDDHRLRIQYRALYEFCLPETTTLQ